VPPKRRYLVASFPKNSFWETKKLQPVEGPFDVTTILRLIFKNLQINDLKYYLKIAPTAWYYSFMDIGLL
jgi:hypothetical protein